MRILTHAISRAFRAVAGSAVEHLPENFIQLGIALGTRGLALSALTGVSIGTLCGASNICQMTLGQGGELAVDVLATGLAFAAAAVWHYWDPLKHWAKPHEAVFPTPIGPWA